MRIYRQPKQAADIRRSKPFTDVRIENLFDDQLEEFLGDTPFIDSLLPLKLDEQLLLEVLRIVHRHHLQLRQQTCNLISIQTRSDILKCYMWCNFRLYP